MSAKIGLIFFFEIGIKKVLKRSYVLFVQSLETLL